MPPKLSKQGRWQGGQASIVYSQKLGARLPVRDAGQWEYLCSKAQSGTSVAMMLLVLCVAGVYISAVFSSSSWSPRTPHSSNRELPTAGISSFAGGRKVATEVNTFMASCLCSHAWLCIRHNTTTPARCLAPEAHLLHLATLLLLLLLQSLHHAL